MSPPAQQSFVLTRLGHYDGTTVSGKKGWAHAGGFLNEPTVTVKAPNFAHNYRLPLPPTGQERIDAVRASLALR